MAKRLAIPSEELKVRVVGSFNYLDVSRVQRLTLNADIPSTDIYEHGNNKLAGTVTDIPNVSLALNMFDVGIRPFAALTGHDPDAYPASGVDISELGEIDAILFVKDATLSDYVKSAHARRLQVESFTFNYSVDGESTEDYNFVGSSRRWFKNDVIVEKFATGTSFSLTEEPIQLKNGDYALSVIADGAYLTEVTGAPADGEYQLSGGTYQTLTLGTAAAAQVMVVYHASPTGSNWSYISDAITPAAIRGKDVSILIAAAGITRVQSVSINGNLNVQAVREMGNDNIVGYQKQVPSITGSINVLDTDTEILDLLINATTTAETEFEPGVECVTSGVPLEIRLTNACDDTVLKTIYIPELVLTGDSYSSTVNQNATLTLNWKSDTAECIIYSGSRP